MDASKTKLWRGDLNKLLAEFQQDTRTSRDPNATPVVTTIPAEALVAIAARDEPVRIAKTVSTAARGEGAVEPESPGARPLNAAAFVGPQPEKSRQDNPAAGSRAHPSKGQAGQAADSPWNQPTQVARHFRFGVASSWDVVDRGKTRLLSRFARRPQPESPKPLAQTGHDAAHSGAAPAEPGQPHAPQRGSGPRRISEQQTVVLPDAAWAQERQPPPRAPSPPSPSTRGTQAAQGPGERVKKAIPVLAVVLSGIAAGAWAAGGEAVLSRFTAPQAPVPQTSVPEPSAAAAAQRAPGSAAAPSTSTVAPAHRAQGAPAEASTPAPAAHAPSSSTTAQSSLASPAPAAAAAEAGRVNAGPRPTPYEPRAGTIDNPRGSTTARSGSSTERAAVDALLAGDMQRAIQHYEQLADAQPDRPAFAAAARILREWSQRPSGT